MMYSSVLRSALVFLVCSPALSSALAQQPGSVDRTFNPGSGVSRSGTARVAAIALQGDGKLLIGGDFVTVNGLPRPGIARLEANGAVDVSFDAGTGADDEVLSIAWQPDGKVLIGGSFAAVNGVERSRVARLNANGRVDMSFHPGTGPDWDVNSLALQGDGKIVLAGGFGDVDGSPRSALARLESNGRLDASFVPNLGNDAFVQTVVLAGDKLVIAGIYALGVPGNKDRIDRLTLAGVPDPAFQGAVADGEVLSVAAQPDGKIIVVGAFSQINGVSRNRIARLNADGSLDLGFNPTGADGDVLAAVIQLDGKIVIGGNFSRIADVVRNGVARLQPDGTLDTSFNQAAGVDGSVQSLALQRDGKILVGGFFTSVDGVARNGIARLEGGSGTSGPVVINPRWSPAGFAASFATTVGQTYTLEFSNGLAGSWAPVATVSGNGTVQTVTDAVSSAAARFYRLRVQ